MGLYWKNRYKCFSFVWWISFKLYLMAACSVIVRFDGCGWCEAFLKVFVIGRFPPSVSLIETTKCCFVLNFLSFVHRSVLVVAINVSTVILRHIFFGVRGTTIDCLFIRSSRSRTLWDWLFYFREIVLMFTAFVTILS